MRHMLIAAPAALLLVAVGCDPKGDYVDACQPAPVECHAGEFVSGPVDVEVLGCADVDGRLTCVIALYLEPGHRGDVAVEATGWGVTGWNEWPTNVEGGRLEEADLIGEGAMCGTISITTDGIGSAPDGHREIRIVVTDDDAGLFALATVEISGPR